MERIPEEFPSRNDDVFLLRLVSPNVAARLPQAHHDALEYRFVPSHTGLQRGFDLQSRPFTFDKQ